MPAETAASSTPTMISSGTTRSASVRSTNVNERLSARYPCTKKTTIATTAPPARSEPMSPANTPSSTKGVCMNRLDAPTSRMMPSQRRRDEHDRRDRDRRVARRVQHVEDLVEVPALIDHLLDADHAGEALDEHRRLRWIDEVHPERLVQHLGRHVVGGRGARELLLEVLVRLLVVFEVELVDER